jgi:hypothetical protein
MASRLVLRASLHRQVKNANKPFPSSLLDVPITAEDEPFTSLNENMNDLDILGEKDDGADLSNDHETNETITTFATSGKHPTAENILEEELFPPTTSTYLLDDDIEDDD